RGKTFRQIFFSAVQAVDRDYERNWAASTLGQPQVSDDLLAFKWNVHDFQRRIEKTRMHSKRFERFCVRTLLPGRSRNRPASEGVEPPCPKVIRIRLLWIACRELSGFIHVAISNAHEGRRPFV